MSLIKRGDEAKSQILLEPVAIDSLPEEEEVPQKKNVRKPISPFLKALWTLVGDPECNHVVSWDLNDVTRFNIHDVKTLKSITLKKYYSAKWESFRRQLYFYGFKGTKDTSWSHANLDHTNHESLHDIKRTPKPKNKMKKHMMDMMRLFQMHQHQQMFMPSNSPMLPPSMAHMNPHSPNAFVFSRMSPNSEMAQSFSPMISPTNGFGMPQNNQFAKMMSPEGMSNYRAFQSLGLPPAKRQRTEL